MKVHDFLEYERIRSHLAHQSEHMMRHFRRSSGALGMAAGS